MIDRSSDIIAHVLAAIAESKRSTRIYGNDAIVSGTFELLPVQAERDVPLDVKFACDLFIEIVVPVRERTCRFHLLPVRMLTMRFLRRLSRGRDHHSDTRSQNRRRKSRRNAERPFHSFFHDLFILRMTAPAGTFCRSSRIDRDRQTRTMRSVQLRRSDSVDTSFYLKRTNAQVSLSVEYHYIISRPVCKAEDGFSCTRK